MSTESNNSNQSLSTGGVNPNKLRTTNYTRKEMMDKYGQFNNISLVGDNSTEAFMRRLNADSQNPFLDNPPNDFVKQSITEPKPIEGFFGEGNGKNAIEIYLIQKIWVHNWETDKSKMVGYEPIGYVNSLEKAKSIVAHGKTFFPANCPAIATPMQEYKYEKLIELNPVIPPQQ